MKLPRLQLHLSTCIVLMFVAGGLVWANVYERVIIQRFHDQVTREIFDIPMGYGYGWPTACVVRPIAEDPHPPLPVGVWNFSNLAINLAAALAILAAVAFACEWVIRRRRKKLDVSGSAPYSEHGKCEDARP